MTPEELAAFAAEYYAAFRRQRINAVGSTFSKENCFELTKVVVESALGKSGVIKA